MDRSRSHLPETVGRAVAQKPEDRIIEAEIVAGWAASDL